jgi:hypothetical protein
LIRKALAADGVGGAIATLVDRLLDEPSGV